MRRRLRAALQNNRKWPLELEHFHIALEFQGVDPMDVKYQWDTDDTIEALMVLEEVQREQARQRRRNTPQRAR